MAMRNTTRRQFIKTSAGAAAAFTIVPRHVLGGPNHVAPSEKINLAIIGCGGQGGGIGRSMGRSDLTQVTALCDVNMGSGRTQAVRNDFKDAKQFQDFREMFADFSDNIDACTIGVPDHAHFPIAILAMSKGKHVYVEKPLAHTFEECEMLIAAEKKFDVACQMGNQGHSGANYFQFKAWREAGVIKDVTRIDAHMNSGRRWHPWKFDEWQEGEEVPETMNWDVWIGKSAMHPYSKYLDGGNWRGWYEYGNGAFGDWGPHILDTCHRFLELGLPTEIEAVKREGVKKLLYPMATTIAFRFPERGPGLPACEVIWYDGVKNKPVTPKELPEGKGLRANGKVIYSKELTYLGGTHSTPLRVIPEEKRQEIKDDLPEYENKHTNHHENFLRACRGEEKTRSSFDVSARLTQVFNLGVIAQRIGGKLKFDPKKKQFTNSDEGNKLLTKTPRKGWEKFDSLLG